MIHSMKLVDFAFNSMKAKGKTIEIRLNDEKRRLISIGDIIEFKHIDTGEILKTKVINLYHFDSFKDLFDNFEHKKLGISDNDDDSIMDNFYTKKEQIEYGALAIEIEII